MKIVASYLWFLLLSVPFLAYGQNNQLSAEEEILILIAKVENSECTFHRNGGSHAATDAADHLRLKLRRGARHAKTTENFITRLASKSSLSGKPYYIECALDQLIPMETWLNTQLVTIRA